MVFIKHDTQEFDTNSITAFSANISAAALYYASSFRGEKGYGAIEGIRLVPHGSGQGVLVLALNGVKMGMFYDETGSINGACTLNLDDSFFKSIKPTSCVKKNAISDSRIIFEKGEVLYSTSKGVSFSTGLKVHPEPWSLDFELLISRMHESGGKHPDTIAFPSCALKAFTFTDYPQGDNIVCTQHMGGVKNPNNILGGIYYVIRNMGKLPFKFVGVTMPLNIPEEEYESMKGLPAWAKSA